MKPCACCPWRKSTDAAKDIIGWAAELMADLPTTCSGDGFSIMACHLTTGRQQRPCAGFVAQVGDESIGLRIMAAQGRLPVVDVEGLDLHSDFASMLAAADVPMPEPSRWDDR